jgi:hypothetical protein
MLNSKICRCRKLFADIFDIFAKCVQVISGVMAKLVGFAVNAQPFSEL